MAEDKSYRLFLNNTEFGEKVFMGKGAVERANNPFSWKNNK
jgi:hypothetical protein